MNAPYLIQVTGVSVADADVLAGELTETLLDSDHTASVERRTRPDGTTVEVDNLAGRRVVQLAETLFGEQA